MIGAQVGHTFVLGARYSEPLLAGFVAPDASTAPVHMACYGIGVTRSATPLTPSNGPRVFSHYEKGLKFPVPNNIT
ncbi:jg22563 [Pararge aegeria aegeria]|uniref:Jg22563 protein n=1 Tax=Pararge aegeria aegeria TaxID=348720 RepID=A0A8S4QHB0_9NEOP|nr:jg22563 [Pararge aegeria aegeria]